MLALFAFASAAAQAAPKHVIYDFGFSGAGAGEFNQARGIAINESGAGGVAAGTVYAVEFGNNRVQQFDADGGFVRAWGGDVVKGGGTGFEICEGTDTCKAGGSGGKAGELNSASGIAVDQSTGDVYVAERSNRRIEQFTATGAFVRAWGRDVSLSGGQGFEICEVAAECKGGAEGAGAGMFGFGGTVAIGGIAVDAAGDVYVADAGNARVQKFDSEGHFLAMGGWDVDAIAPSVGYEVCSVAADCKAGLAGGESLVGGEATCQFGGNNLPSFLTVSPAGDVYAVGGEDGAIYRLSSALACDTSFHPAAVPSGENNRNALAFSGGHLFFTKRTSSVIFELDPATQAVVEEHTAGGDQWVGLAVNGTTGRIYATRTTSATSVRVLDEGVYPKPTTSAASGKSGTKATLNGAVNPEGVELTECRFEYGLDGAYRQSVPCAETPAEIGAGAAPVAVHAAVSGLSPATKYNFRLSASNPKTAKSANLSFETLQTTVTAPADAVSGTAATLHGTVNPDGEDFSSCTFEWGTTAAYGNTAPCAQSPAEIGTGTSPVPVDANLTGLAPGTVFHFRLTATYQSGAKASGIDRTFQTLGPAILGTWSQGVTLTEATLKASIDPEGLATTYHFEYGPTVAYGAETTEAPVGSDSTAHTVSSLVAGLAPGATYHYRVVATSADAANQGPDRTFTTRGEAGDSASCPNQAFREGPGAFLPDCRAYEMVSPVDKNGGDIVNEPNSAGEHTAYIQSTPAGDKIAYSAAPAFGDQASALYSNQYIASRGESGPHEGDWSNQGVNVPLGKQLFAGAGWLNNEVGAFSADLCHMWIADHNSIPLNPDGQEGFINLYRRSNCGSDEGAYETLTTAEPSAGATQFYVNASSIQGMSEDLGKVFFTAGAKLTSQAATGGNNQVYLHLRDEPEPRLVSILPNSEAAPSAGANLSEVGGGFGGSFRNVANLSDAVSADGSRVYWSAEAATGKTIYLRENPAAAETGEKEDGNCVPHPSLACTVRVSPGTDATYWAASPDGSSALYSEGSLGSGAATLYRFEAPGQTRTPIAEGVYGLAGASEDLARIYLASGIDHDGAGPAAAGKPNLYLLEGGAFTFIGTLLTADASSATGPGGGETYSVTTSFSHFRSTRVTPDGGRIAFQAQAALTGYDNADAATGAPGLEVYTYAAGGELRCASCNPSGARPQTRELSQAFSYPSITKPTGIQAAAWIPGWEHPLHASRLLSDDGKRLFFNSNDALVARDTNGAQDVYEWEEAGNGGCEVGGPGYFEQNGGCLYLISSGESPRESEFWEASASGEDVFFTTASSLVGRDNGYIDLYDARVGGGFAEAEAKAQCEGEACQSPPPAPPADTPASATYSGPGDLAAPDSCARAARKAVARSRRAKRLRRNSARVGSPRRARQMRGKSTRLARNARKLSRKAKRCRRANRRAGR